MINLIATDLDGTLLDDHHQFNQEKFTHVLKAIKQHGGHLIIASGEQLDWCEQHFARWAKDLSFVAANGPVVADRGGHVLAVNQFSPREKQNVASTLATLNIDQYVIGEIRAGVIMRSAPTPFQQIMKFYYPHLKLVDNWQEIDEPIVKIAIAVDEGSESRSAAQLNQQLDDNLQAIVGGNGELDIVQVGSDKASGVQKLLNYFGQTAEHLLVFGDQLNDATMFKLAGQSCAVANAVPAIKHLATKIIPSNNDGGVLQELSRRFC